jgi:hypothetical protein
MFCGHLEYFVAITFSFPRFGMLYQEKYANSVREALNNPWKSFEGAFGMASTVPPVSEIECSEIRSRLRAKGNMYLCTLVQM